MKEIEITKAVVEVTNEIKKFEDIDDEFVGITKEFGDPEEAKEFASLMYSKGFDVIVAFSHGGIS